MSAEQDLLARWQGAEGSFMAGDLALARTACEAVLQLSPQHSRAHLMLSDICRREDRLRLATGHACRAADPMGSQPLEHVAAVTSRLIAAGEYETAAHLLRRIDPGVAPAPAILVEFSQQLSLLELHSEALALTDVAIARGIEAHSLGYLRGNLLRFLGRIDEAAEEYERRLFVNADFSYAHWALAYLGLPASGARVDRIRSALANTGPDDRDICYLHYALFRELDALDDTGPAWAALEAGARAKRERVQYEALAESALFAALARATGPGFAGQAGAAGELQTPIFVLGMPRTGTTLLERILAGNAAISQGGELNDFRMQFRWCSDHHSPGFIDGTGIARLHAVDYPDLGRRYLQHVAWRAPQARFLSDKNPTNFVLIGLILKALPHARILHLRRNPMDACFSNLKELFAANSHPYSYDLDELAAHYRNYSDLMQHWHDIAPGRILDVHYEDLVSSPDASARRVMAYCGLDYDPAQLRIETQEAPVSTASSAQVRQPIHARNVGGWKRYAMALAPLQEALGPLVR